MEADPILFRDLTYVFLAATLGGLLAWRLKLPLILGFVVGGVVISPFTPGPQLSDLHTFEVFAEVGVVLLMFSIGVEFSIPDLMQVKWVAIGGGTLGITMSIALALIASWLAGWSTAQGIVVGATISVASTMVMARLLTDRGALGTTYGRVMIGITLVEDLAVVFMTVVLPVFNGPVRRPPPENRLDARQSSSLAGSSRFSRDNGGSKASSSRAQHQGSGDFPYSSLSPSASPPQRSRKHSVFQ